MSFILTSLSSSDYFWVFIQKLILNVLNSTVYINASYRFVHLWDVYETVDVFRHNLSWSFVQDNFMPSLLQQWRNLPCSLGHWVAKRITSRGVHCCGIELSGCDLSYCFGFCVFCCPQVPVVLLCPDFFMFILSFRHSFLSRHQYAGDIPSL